MSNLKVGDLCVTQNAVAGLLNNGLLVVITHVEPALFDGSTYYMIRRIDGQPFPAQLDPVTGVPRFFSGLNAWAPKHKLRRIDPDTISECERTPELLTEPA